MKSSNIIFGVHPILEALESGRPVDKIFFQRDARSEGLNKIRQLALKKGIHFQFVPVEKLNRMKQGNHQGVIALISEIDYADLETLLPGVFEGGRDPFILILDKITDVRNFGAISRSALCAGVDAVVIPVQGSAQINSEAMKASAGALNKIPICKSENLKQTIALLKNSGLTVVSCTEKAQTDLYRADLGGPIAVILGSEETGISEEYLKLSDQKVRIPMAGSLDSLNVSVAAGIIMFEILRQRRFNN